MSTPEFKAALAQYQYLSKTLGPDHDITKNAFIVLFSLAPDEYVDEAHKIAVEMDLIPDSTGYLEDGTAIYRLDDIAAKLEIPIEEAEHAMHEMMAVRKEAGFPVNDYLVDDSLIHRRQ